MAGEDPTSPLIQTESILTCPRCGHRSAEQMSIDSCRFFYTCKGCGETLKPLPGGLLRVLFLRHSAVPPDAAGAALRVSGERS